MNKHDYIFDRGHKLFFEHDDDNVAGKIDNIDDEDDVDEECSQMTLETPAYNKQWDTVILLC